MKIAYFVNQYPLVSLTFIRREISSLEALGVTIERFALRGWASPITDPAHMVERSKTRYVLQRGVSYVLLVAAVELLRRPLRTLRAMRLVLRMTVGGDRTILHHAFSVAEAAVLARWFRLRGVGHVHAHFGTNSAEVAMLASALGGVSYSFTVHGVDEWDMPRQLKIAEKVRNAAFVVAISSFTRAQLMRWADLDDYAKIHVIHCGVEVGFSSRETQALPEEVTAVCVGRLCSAKSQNQLIDAMVRLRSIGVRMRLMLVGDGELRGMLEDQIKRNDLGESVIITGWATEAQVRTYIESAHFMVLPSLAEGLPVAIMEAMALGRPVLSTHVGGIPELVRNGIEGWLVPASDQDALAEALATAAKMGREELAEMGRLARARVLERHDSSTEARKLEKLLRLHVSSAARMR
jgi:colanic acid/amylovoran biosynthesis glycosyltransferase